MSYLELAKQAEARLRVARGERQTCQQEPNAVAPTELPIPASTYRAALWAWWALAETAPLAAFHDALMGLRAAEDACPQAEVRATLHEAAEAWHRETGRCPFCGKPGPLHTPSEALWEATP